MRCRSCGAATRPTARFCDQCGSQLDDVRPALKRPPAIPGDGEAGDRRIVTALFADLVDYVRLVAENDPEDVRRRVDAALLAMVDAIEAFDGTREKFIGDAVFAVFGWPRGHDDDALRAAHCALAIREALARVDEPGGDEPLLVRIGVATGEVVAAPRSTEGAFDWSLTGPAVTTAARIQAIAQPGEILLDEATIRAARKGLEVEDRGLQLLRGQSRPIRVGRLLGQAGFQPWRPPAGRLVGRGAERDRLRRLLDDLAHGRGRAIVIEGEAGIGKSRLLADVAIDARALALGWTWVDNVSYGSAEPYRFARAFAQAVADEHGTDSGSLARQLLFTGNPPPEEAQVWAGGVAAMAREAAFSGWEKEAALVPTDPSAVADAVRRTSVRYVERLVEVSGPRVIVVDDLHWIDPSSAGMVEEMIQLARRIPLLLLIATRPGASPVTSGLESLERMALTGLDPVETRELAAAILGSRVDPADARRLHDRTAGNPLFITETVRALIDDPAVHAPARLALGTPPGAVGMPVTLRALLGARIDGLSDEGKAVVRVAAVVGMSFTEEVIAEVLGEAVEPAVYDRLAEASLIVRLDSPGAWRFGHPLIHDAAYGGLLGSSRRRLHARVADLLETRAATGPIGAVARHRVAAGDGDRAVPLLVEAAEESFAVGAPAEAASFWTAAADIVASLTDAETYRQRARDALDAIPPAGSTAG